MVRLILDFAGENVRKGELFGNEDPIAITKKFLKGLQVNKTTSSPNVDFVKIIIANQCLDEFTS